MIGPLRSSSTDGRPGRRFIGGLVSGLPRYLKLIAKLIGDPRVSNADKALLGAALAYVLAPLDLIPDFIPLVGLLDDLFFVALAIDRLVASAGPELVQLHWDGPEEALATLNRSLDSLAQLLPAPVRRRLVEGVESR